MPTITGTSDSEVLVGGPGDDSISDTLGGLDLLQGLGGNDTLYIARQSYSERHFDPIRLEGGSGDDTLILDVRNRAPLILDGGDGDDFFQFWSLTGPVTLITGDGSDRIYFDASRMGASTGQLLIVDFTTGAGGDLFDLLDWLPARIGEWGSNNPFSTGHLQLTQDGADTLLIMGHQVLATFQNTLATDFTAANLRWSPDGVGGAAGEVFSGTAADDQIVGTNGDDLITGGAGDDLIVGNAGDDQIDGGGGQDHISGGFGSDLIHGGAGADWLEDSHGVADALYGDGGNDNIELYRSWDEPVGNLIADGGDGDDIIWLTLYNDTFVDVFGGAGDDIVHLTVNQGRVRITTGAGRDSIDINGSLPGDPAVTVTDFTPGATGDHILWLDLIDNNLVRALGGSPFASGHARLIQSGPDTLLQLDRDGGGDDWDTSIVFENTDASAFVAENFGGYAPSGAELAGQILNGTSVAETMSGTRGDDVITLFGGDDRAYGGQGHDVINGGDGDDILDGEDGSDTVWGGAGDDQLDAGENGADVLHGGDGADILNLWRSPFAALQSVEANGDDGGDTIYLDLQNGASAILRGGSGDDVIFVGSGGDITVSTGSGSDTVTYGGYYTPLPARLEITDFAVGTDTLDWTDFRGDFSGLNGANPFLTGHARLIQDGADAVLQFDTDGGADGFEESIRFRNIDATTLSGAALGFQALAFDHIGTAASEFLYGSYLADQIDGAGGSDVLRGGGGDDILNGGDGVDQASFADAVSGVTVDLRLTGPQTVGGGLGSDTLISIEEIIGSAYGDHLAGDNGVNYISGGDGDDVIDGGLGADGLAGDGGNDLFRFTSVSLTPVAQIGTVNGGLGVDTLDLTTLGATILGQLNGSSFRLIIGGQGYTVISIERILTGAGADTIDVRYFSGALEIQAGDGDDIIQTGWGADVIHGGEGADHMVGAAGDDTYHVDNRNDVVVEVDGGGVDRVLSAISFDARFTHVENIILTGEAAANVVANDLNNVIVGNSAANVLKGLGGNDTYHVDSRDDAVIEVAGGGIDTVLSTVSFDARFTHVENITLTGAARVNAVGNDLNNILIGNSAANVLKGLGGNDTYVVDGRDDVVIEVAGGGIDTVLSSVSFDARAIHVENITLTGGSNANAVANDLGNTIVGNSAANIILGNGGADRMTGGGGSDTFRYNSVSDSSFSDYDRIMDLGGDDFIDLRNIDANANVAGNQSFTQVDELTGQAGQMTVDWLASAGFTLMSMDIDGDGVADMRIVLYGDHSDFDNFLGVGGG